MSSYYNHPAYEAIKEFFAEGDFWQSCAYGLPYLMRRTPHSKAWCGYVGVPKGHPHFGRSFGERVQFDWSQHKIGAQSPVSIFIAAASAEEGDNLLSIDMIYDCPGGITWAADHAAGGPRDSYWWFGFDCSHYNDLTPADAFRAMYGDALWALNGTQTYRDFKFVRAACMKLASQLSDFTSNYPEHFEVAKNV